AASIVHSLALHDALPICGRDHGEARPADDVRLDHHGRRGHPHAGGAQVTAVDTAQWRYFRIGDIFSVTKGVRLTRANMVPGETPDRKSTRLNSSHVSSSY